MLKSCCIGSLLDMLWMLKFSSQLDAGAIDLIVVLVWCLWSVRNKSWLGGVRQSVLSIVQWAHSYLE